VLYPCCVASLNIPIVDDTIHILEFLLGDMSTPRVDLLEALLYMSTPRVDLLEEVMGLMYLTPWKPEDVSQANSSLASG
jgi:hypothetical protein